MNQDQKSFIFAVFLLIFFFYFALLMIHMFGREIGENILKLSKKGDQF